MLIQVTTKTGQEFWRAGIKFGPRPTRLWVGPGKAPDRKLQVIDKAALAKIEASAGEHGPLLVEKDAPHLRSDDARAELARKDARIAELERDLEAARGAYAKLDVEMAEEQARAAGLARDLDQAEARIAELEGSYQAALDRITTLEQAAAEPKPRRGGK